jgi:hypothetical protein
VPFVGRSFPACLAVSALVGLSGCLLFTDPINEAPVVRIQAPDGDIRRGDTTYFTIAELKDEDNLTDVEWATIRAKNEGCSGITYADWLGVLDTKTLERNAPYDHRFDSLAVMCVCARATDSHGAVGYAPCVRVAPQNVPPEAIITDVEGKSSGETRPLCSDIHLSAATSKFPRDKTYDTVDFNWTLVYSGPDPNGASVHLGECTTGVAQDVGDQHRCFYAAVPGTYTVSLSITDTPSAEVGGAPLTSPTVSFDVKVDVDKPAWLQRTAPDVLAQDVLLGANERRTFAVSSVDDDCEPIPAPAGKNESRLVWSLWDPTGPNPPQWVYLATSAKSLEVTQAWFHSPVLGGTAKIRVEVRDAVAEKLYKTPGYSPCLEQVDICCEASGCTDDPPHARWTTWTVHFQP